MLLGSLALLLRSFRGLLVGNWITNQYIGEEDNMPEWPVGVGIEGVRWMNDAEREMLGWKSYGVVILLDDGGMIFASSDKDAKRPGVLQAVTFGGGPEPLEAPLE